MAALTDIVANDVPKLFDALCRVTQKFGNTRPWWRGQAVLNWDLLASIHRPGKTYNEQALAQRFRNMGQPRYAKCPDSADLASWLFLMQHYRLPTRLLDWSESPLVAIFFAVEDTNHDDKDGVLWALEPMRLNKVQIGVPSVFDATNTSLGPFFSAAINGGETPQDKVLAVAPSQLDTRHMIQQAMFTIHASRIALNHQPSCDNFLVRIRIPKAAKMNFRESLKILGIGRATLFPDLENLTTVLRETEFSAPV